MKVSDYVLSYIEKLGVKSVFVVTGAAIAPMIDAFSRNNHVKYICMVHEQAGSFASETLTKVDNILGVNMVTSGPGGINLLTGIANCWYDSIPNLFITGQINSDFIKSDNSLRQIGFQENDIVAMAKPITKFSTIVTNAEDIKWALDKAIHEATNDRPGPVLIDIPINIQKQEIVPTSLIGYTPDKTKNNYNIDEVIDVYLENLNESERPVLLIGGGVRLANAIEEVRELGRLLKIPCLPTWNALDVFDSEYEYYVGRIGTYGGPGRNFAIQNSDQLLTIGCRLSGRITGGVIGSFAREATKFIVDVDKANLTPELQQVKGDYNIYCDAKVFIQALINKTKVRKIKKFNSWLNKSKDWCKKYDPVRPEYFKEEKIVNPYVFVDELSKQVDSDAIIVVDCGGNVVVTSQAFKTKFGQRLCSSNGNSPMGYSFAGAIGACYAARARQVICLIGDGGFTMNIQELQTLKNYNLPLKTFIMNNKVYGIIKAFQETNLEGRYLASGPDGYNPPDFIKIIQAYGIETESIQNHSDLINKIDRVLKFDGPCICDIKMDDYYTYEPRIFGWQTPIEDMFPYIPRDEFLNNMQIKPMEGWDNPALPGIVDKTFE